MIHVGVYKDSDQINIEKCSSNNQYNLPDIQDKCPNGMCCIKDGPEKLTTGLNVDKLCHVSNNLFKEKCCSENSKCGPSDDPGK
jgi:hypothetical protein